MTATMRLLKRLFTLCLCLIVLVTSATSAVAALQMASGQMMQICADGQAMTVMLDAQGNQVDPDQPCPDCLAVTAALPPANPGVAQDLGTWTRIEMPTAALFFAHNLPQAIARGPPVLI